MMQSRQAPELAAKTSMSGIDEQSMESECACATLNASRNPPVSKTEVGLQLNGGSCELDAHQVLHNGAACDVPGHRPTLRHCGAVSHCDYPSSAAQAQSQVGHEIADTPLQVAPLGDTSRQLCSGPSGHSWSHRESIQDCLLDDSPWLVDHDLRLAIAQDDSGVNKMAATPPRSSATSTLTSTPTYFKSPPSHESSDIYAYLQARLSDPARPGTCTSTSPPTPTSSQSSTSRRSTRSRPSTSATTPRATLSPSSSRLPSGASTPIRPSRSSTSSRRASTSTKPYKPPIRTSNPDSSLLVTASDTFPRLVIVQHAVSASAYIFVTLLAGITLLAFVLAGYGLTLADDARRRIRRVKNKATRSRRRVLQELGRRAKLLSEELAERARKLEDPSFHHSRASSRAARRTATSDGLSDEPKDDLASARTGPVYASSQSVFASATAIAAQSYRIFTSQVFVPPIFKTYSAFSSAKIKSGLSYDKPPISPNAEQYCTPESSGRTPETDDPHHTKDYFPPRPPLGSLIPSILLALLLALVAFVKTSQIRKASAGK